METSNYLAVRDNWWDNWYLIDTSKNVQKSSARDALIHAYHNTVISKIYILPKFSFCIKLYFFDKIFVLFYFLSKVLSVSTALFFFQIFIFCKKFHFLSKLSFSVKIFVFFQKFHCLSKLSFVGKSFIFFSKFLFFFVKSFDMANFTKFKFRKKFPRNFQITFPSKYSKLEYEYLVWPNEYRSVKY